MATITEAQAQAAGEQLGLPPIITLEEAARTGPDVSASPPPEDQRGAQ